MNIIAIENLPTTSFGGSERSYFDVLTGLRARGHEVTLFYNAHGNLIRQYEDSGVKTRKMRAPHILRPGRRLRDFLAMIRAFQDFRSEKGKAVIYINFAEALPFSALLKIIYRYPIVCHIRLGFGGLTRQILWAGRLADSIVVINKKFKHSFEQAFKRKDGIFVIYNGIRIPSNLPPLIKKPVGKDLRILYLGRIAPEKGISQLVRVFFALVQSEIRCSLQITGGYILSHSGNYKAELEDLISELRVGHLITFSSPVEDPVPYMANYDLFVFPSIWEEPFGRTVPEAILAGTPVLARSVGMIEEIMADNPHFIFDTDETLIKKIVQFHNGELIFDFEKARKRMVNDFNRDRMVVEVENVLERCSRKGAGVLADSGAKQ